MPTDADALRSETAAFRAQQLAEVPTRRAAAAHAVESGMDGLAQIREFLATHWVRVIDLLRQW